MNDKNPISINPDILAAKALPMNSKELLLCVHEKSKNKTIGVIIFTIFRE